MTVEKMAALFEVSGVPKSCYVLDGKLGLGECLGIEKFVQGWHLYYSERGKKITQKIFATENEACLYMIESVGEQVGKKL